MARKGDKRAGRGGWLIGAVALGALLAVGLVIWLQQSQASVPPPPTAAAPGQSLGPAAAPVVVEEFADFQCPFCREAALTTVRRLEADAQAPGSNFRFVFRTMAFIGPESKAMAEAAACAGAQSKFFPYMDKLFAEQRPENSGYFTRDRLLAYASGLGLDQPRFAACLDQGQMRPQVAADTARANALQVTSTPTFAINGKPMQSGLQPYEKLRQAIDAAAAAK